MSYSLYIHLPFCKRRCPYCSFSSTAGAESFITPYMDAVALEFNLRSKGLFAGSPSTLFIGGGTPSLVPAQEIKKCVRNIYSRNITEFTVEANPESIDRCWLDGILECGANRLSIGIQSLDDDILRRLGRLHTTVQSVESVKMARTAGFTNISVDLMFGIPGQTMEIWKNTLENVLELAPDHVSGYCLSIEEDTEYYNLYKSKKLTIPDPDETADMYILMCEILEKKGLFRYETSNFAHKGRECKHNQAYWNFTPYMGIGASAHSFENTFRRWNICSIQAYINTCYSGNDPISGFEETKGIKRALEKLMLSLRTIDGLDVNTFILDPVVDGTAFNEKITLLVDSHFLEYSSDGNVVLTFKGAIIADEIISELAIEGFVKED